MWWAGGGVAGKCVGWAGKGVGMGGVGCGDCPHPTRHTPPRNPTTHRAKYNLFWMSVSRFLRVAPSRHPPFPLRRTHPPPVVVVVVMGVVWWGVGFRF